MQIDKGAPLFIGNRVVPRPTHNTYRHREVIGGTLFSELSPSQTNRRKIVSVLQELRKELEAIRQWNEADFTCSTEVELDAVANRILRMAEIKRKLRELAERN